MSSIRTLTDSLTRIALPVDVEAVMFPSFLHIGLCKDLLAPSSIDVGAQNCWDATSLGQFTGCVTAKALEDFGVRWCAPEA